MKSERIGNDIKIEWSILREGTPFSLSNKDVSIYLGSQFGRTKISGFTIDSNKVIWTFFGKDQKSLGKYSLVLVINEGNEGMITTDICDFVNLVSCTCEVGGTDNEDVQTETIALTSNLEYVASEYYDDTAIWEYIEKMEKAKADKAEIPTRVSQLENDAEYATVGDLGGKQDKISDLDAIRRGAQKGASALQEIPAEYVNDKELDNALRPKVNRYEVATINGQSILNGGNIVIEGGSGDSYDDTGIKKDISDLKAKDTEQDAELAKLSEEVGKLGKPIFEAKYGETTFDEIVAAKNDGKWVILIKDRLTYHLSFVAETLAYFATINNNISYSAYINKATNGWVEGIKTLEQTPNKTTTISEASTDAQYPSAKAVYDALPTLLTLPNGNLKVTIDGVSKGFMPATPSGDPMHYMFEAAGATYNATDADIPMVGIYGDSYVHKAHHWHLNELGDITNEEMRKIYGERYPIASMSVYQEWFSTMKNSRTNCSAAITDAGVKSFSYAYYNTEYRTIRLGISNEALINAIPYVFSYSSRLEKVLTILNINNINSAINNAFQTCKSLKEVRVKGVKVAISLPNSSMLSNASIMYMIENEAATAAITITLHADAYDRAMADAEIQAALTAHPNVSLAK